MERKATDKYTDKYMDKYTDGDFSRLLGYQVVALAKDITEIKETLKGIQRNISYQNIIHHNAVCNSCQRKPIIGIRYKCTECQDFDLCEYCIDLTNHQQDHLFLRITNPIAFEMKKIAAPVNKSFGNSNFGKT